MSAQEFVDSLVAAFGSHDVAGYFAHFDERATFLFHDAPARLESRAEYESLWATWEAEDGFRVLACTSSNQRLQEVGDLAVLSHDVHTVREVGGEREELRERETIVLARTTEDRGWTCVHEHLSPAPAAG